ncbi:hypothetical protein FACS189485_05990 [Spirochaetia bacterium]|nr:hypothetical protein FACS189485_05990 [Spirochaetia bacterium]
MTEAEAGKLERLCNGFSALTDENKLAALAVSKALLTFRRPGAVPEDKGLCKGCGPCLIPQTGKADLALYDRSGGLN